MILNKLKLVDNIVRDLADNSTGKISPHDVRQNMLDVIDSIHLLTADQNLYSKNFGTVDTRTTRAGDLAIGKLHLDGYVSVDNSAFGYSSLSENYNGARNTAIGSHALSCNLYGSGNTAVGVSAIAGNVFGSGNVALGNLALQRNKWGNYNIAIGHGAGYYIGQNESHRFYLGSHIVDDNAVCSNPLGSGLTPLMLGDLKDLKLGIAVSGLHEYGTLQVGGDIVPSENPGKYNLGHQEKRWKNIFASEALDYPDSSHFSIRRTVTTTPAGVVTYTPSEVIYLESGGMIGLGTNAPSGTQGLVTSKGNIVPKYDNSYSIGHPDLMWSGGYFKNISVSGTADITTFNYKEINSCTYECKTLYLASSGDPCYSGGPPCGYLTDQELEGGGLVLQSSGAAGSAEGFFRRNYEWTYRAPDSTLTCLEIDSPYSRSTWNSNISIHVASGSHLKTDRVIGRDSVALLNENGCYGWFIQRDDDIIRTGDLGQNEIQKITVNATAGTFTLTYSGQTTSAIAFDASSADIQSALEALSNIEVGDIVVTGNDGGVWTVTFTGSLAKTNVAQITCTNVDLTLGGTANESSRTFFAHRFQSRVVSNHSHNGVLRDFWAYQPPYIRIRSNQVATQGSFKLRMRREDTNVLFDTELIPFDATRTEICDAVNAAVLAQGITGVTLHAWAYEYRQDRVPVGHTISSIVATYNLHNPTYKALSTGNNHYSYLFWVDGRSDRAGTFEIPNPKISFYTTEARSSHISQPFHDYGMDGVLSLYASEPHAGTYNNENNTHTDFIHWADNSEYDTDAEPSDVGFKVVWRQERTGMPDNPLVNQEVEFNTSDTVAMAQPKFDAVFGAGAVEISSNGTGMTNHTVGLWPEGSAGDDFAQAGWYIKYKSAELLAEDKVPYIIYEGADPYHNVGQRFRTLTGLTGDTTYIFYTEMPRLGVALYRHEGEGPTVDPGSCSTATTQDGSADITAITKVDNVVYLTKEDHIKPNPISPEGKIGNVTDVNFIASGVDRDYHISYSHLNEGVTVGQRLVTRTMEKRTDTAIPPREKVTGFSIDYIDEADAVGYTGQRKDRLVIAAYDDTVAPLNALTIMRSDDPGLVGISDIENAAHVILPETIFNIQSTGETIARNTTWGAVDKTSLQLLGAQNNPLDEMSEGVELEYTVTKRRADMSLWDDGGNKIVITLDNDNKFIGIHKLDPNEMLTLGSGLDGSDPAISMHERAAAPTQTPDYGKIYIKPKTVANQTQSAYLLDDAGNEFDLTLNKYDMNDARALYTDEWGNTLGGLLSNKDRSTIDSSETCNTAYGHKALYDINGGDVNTAIGCEALQGVTTGSNNIVLGGQSADQITTGSNNIIIGTNALATSESDISDNLIIGGDGIGNGLGSDYNSSTNPHAKKYNFILGTSYNETLMTGKTGPTAADRELTLPLGKLRITASNDELLFSHKVGIFGSDPASVIEVIDNNHDRPEGGLAFLFTGMDEGVVQNQDTLFKLRSHAAMDTTCNEWPGDISRTRPYAELQGDLFLAGSIQFCDGTSMDSTSGIVIIAGTGISEQLSSVYNNMEFHLNIEEMNKANASPNNLSAIPSNDKSYVALSTSGVVGKMSLLDLSTYLDHGKPFISGCYNHIFSNTSTINTTVNCRNFYAGYRAGHGATGWTDSNFIGTEAGAGATIAYNEATNWSSTFIGYRAGYNAANVDHAVFIGAQAGNDADNAKYSVFIGDSAGDRSGSSRSIGIGDNALAGTAGTNNIEITAGIGGSNRIMSDVATHDNRLAIGTCIAGISSLTDRRISIGSPNFNPDAVLQVQAHGSEARLQEWKNNAGTVVAYVDNAGNYVKV